MSPRLSNHLSPRAKERFLTASSGEPGVALVELAPNADHDALRAGIERLGGTVRSYVPASRLMHVEIPAGRLADLAESAGVVHVAVEERYSA